MYKRNRLYKKIIIAGERFNYQMQDMYQNHIKKILLILGFVVAYIANILLTIFVLMTAYRFLRNFVGGMNLLSRFSVSNLDCLKQFFLGLII